MRSLRRTGALALSLTLAWTTLVVTTAAAASPVVGLQGVLRNQAGGPVPDGEYAMAVAIYAEANGGEALFEETFLAVELLGGFFTVQLGANKEALSGSLFQQAPRFVGITIGGNPELPRTAMVDVPTAVHAHSAGGLTCSGCVGAGQLAAAAVGGEHVAFMYAGSQSKGGPADAALTADFATKAGSATSADEANTAAVASTLQCTGCVTAAMIANGTTAALVDANELAAVAVTGKYADIEGGPDLSGYGALQGANAWLGKQTFGGGVVHAADADFDGKQALYFRFHNSEGAPVDCNAGAAGMAYFDPKEKRLVVCNGAAWVVYAEVGELGSQGNPAASCKAIADAGIAQNGVYWLEVGDTTLQAYCDLAGGGWTLVMTTSDSSAYVYDHVAWTQQDGADMVPMPDANADAVSRAFYKMTASQTRVCMKAHGTGNMVCEELLHSAATGRALANGPVASSNQGANDKLTDNWRSIVAGSVWGAWAWHRFGWNSGAAPCGGVRIGFTADNDSSDSRDSGIGIGVWKGGCSSKPDLTVGSGYYHYTWNPLPDPHAAGLEGFIWLR